MKITYTKTGGIIRYDQTDWLGSLDTTSAGSAYRIGNGLAFASNADPLRRLSYISPGYLGVDLTNVSVVDAFLRNGVISNQSAYIISGGTKLHEATSLDGTPALTNAGVWPHTISDGHASIVGNDICNYYNTTPNLCTFYSYTDGTDWNVGIYNQITPAFDDDFMSTIPTTPLAAPYLAGGKDAPHPMIVGADDVLYIGDRNFVHAYDYVTNTFSATVLTLPKGWIITSFAKLGDIKLAIGAYYSTFAATVINPTNGFLGQSAVWVWNYLDLDPEYSRDLHDNFVSEIFNWNGAIAAFTSGRKTLSQSGIYKLQVSINEGEFTPVQTWSTGGLPIRGGVEVVEGDVYWNSGGTIYSYLKNPYTGKYAFYQPTTGTGTTSGMLRIFTNIFRIFASTGTTTSGGLQYFSTGYANGQAWGKVAQPVFPNESKGKLVQVVVTYADTTSAGLSFRLNTQLDHDGGTPTFSDLTTVSSIRQQIRNNKADNTPLGQFTYLQPQMIWTDGLGTTSAPLIESIEYEYELVNI